MGFTIPWDYLVKINETAGPSVLKIGLSEKEFFLEVNLKQRSSIDILKGV